MLTPLTSSATLSSCGWPGVSITSASKLSRPPSASAFHASRSPARGLPTRGLSASSSSRPSRMSLPRTRTRTCSGAGAVPPTVGAPARPSSGNDRPSTNISPPAWCPWKSWHSQWSGWITTVPVTRSSG
jgi:hypothetical protein